MKIKGNDILTIDKYINEALYNNKTGYYMKKNPFGKKGDFITAPNISILFSEMIAVWVVSFWENLKSPKEFNLIELGAGNCLIDQCVQEFTAKKSQFDNKGRIAEKGSLKDLSKIIESFLSSDYFQENLPKSQAIINFNFKKISRSKLKNHSFNDWASAMTEITALSIVRDLEKFCKAKKVEIYFCGGGSKNNFLIRRIRDLLNKDYEIKKINNLGIDPMLIEACTFAWLSKKRIKKEEINLLNSTGAKPSLLGEIF